MSRIKLFVIYELLVLCTMSFILLLGFLVSQNTNKEDSIASKIISSNELTIDLERSLSFGKTYSEDTNFARLMTTMVDPIAQEINLQSIIFIDNNKNNNILYSYTVSRAAKSISSTSLPHEFFNPTDAHGLIKYNNLYWIKVDLYKKDFRNKNDTLGEYTGAYFMSFPRGDFFISAVEFIKSYLIYFSIIFAVTSLILYLLIFHSSIKFISNDGYSLSHKSYLYALILIAQIATSAIILQGLYDFFIKDSQHILQRTATVQAQKITRLLDLGLPITTLARSGEFFTQKLSVNENIYSFSILDKNKESIVHIVMGETPHSSPTVTTPLKSKDKQILGYVETQLDVTGINSRLISAIADLLTVFIISILVSSEVMLLFTLSNPLKINKKSPKFSESFMGYTRFIHALVGCAYSLALSFLPLKMLSMLKSSESLIPPMLISSLPLSAEFFGTVISFYLSDKYALKYGWQRTLFGGGIVYAFAATISSFTVNPELFIASRALAGIGYGFIFLPILIHSTSILDNSKTATCFAVTNAGFMSGFMTGASLGGILATQSGTELPFLLATSLSITLMLYTYCFLRPYFKPLKSEENIRAKENTIKKPAKLSLLNYLSNKNICGTLGLVLIPYAAAQLGMLSYGLPMTLAELDFSPSTVGRAMMMYGLIQVYIAPSLSQYFEGFANRKLILFGGLCIAILGFFIVGINEYTPFVSIFIIGISSAIIYPMASAFSVNQPISNAYGKEKSVMIYKLTDKTGQALGPICLGALFSAFNYNISLIIIGFCLIVTSFLFMLLIKNR